MSIKLVVQLVIFDCDGVLVDSELITNRVFAEMLGELGLPVTLDYLFEHFVGRSIAHCHALIADMLSRPIPEAFVAEYRVRTTQALEAQLEAGAHHTFNDMRKFPDLLF